MARKRKTSTAEDFLDLIALLPWWAGVALALISYMVLHAIAIRPLPSVQNPQQIGSPATTAIWQGLATGGQYLLPLLCLAGAAISAVRKRRRSQLFESTSASASADALKSRTPACFQPSAVVDSVTMLITQFKQKVRYKRMFGIFAAPKIKFSDIGKADD